VKFRWKYIKRYYYNKCLIASLSFFEHLASCFGKKERRGGYRPAPCERHFLLGTRDLRGSFLSEGDPLFRCVRMKFRSPVCRLCPEGNLAPRWSPGIYRNNRIHFEDSNGQETRCVSCTPISQGKKKKKKEKPNTFAGRFVSVTQTGRARLRDSRLTRLSKRIPNGVLRTLLTSIFLCRRRKSHSVTNRSRDTQIAAGPSIIAGWLLTVHF